MHRIAIHLNDGTTITTIVAADAAEYATALVDGYATILSKLKDPDRVLDVIAHDVHERIPTAIPVRSVAYVEMLQGEVPHYQQPTAVEPRRPATLWGRLQRLGTRT